MNMNARIVIPTLAAIVLTASAAIAQMPPAGPRAGRTPPTAEQRAARLTQFCDDMKARQAARFTFVEERLKLTAAQKPLFDRWKAAEQSVQAAHQADCAKPLPARDANAPRPSLTERNARMEEMLKTRLADLEKVRGPQEALYNALSDDQKMLFERGDRGGFGMRRAGLRFGPGRGPGGPGFDGPGLPGPRFQRGPGPNGPT
jgi:hypothetical protein